MTGIALGLGFIAGVIFGPVVVPVVVVLVAARLVWPGRGTLIVPALLFLVATCLGTLRGEVATRSSSDWPADTAAIVGKVVTDPNGLVPGERFVVEVTGANRGREWMAARGRICVESQSKQSVGYGDIVQLAGLPKSLVTQSGVVQDIMAETGCGATLLTFQVRIEQTGRGPQRMIGHLRRRIDETLLAAAPGDSGALLAGLVTGNDWHLSQSRREAFFATGTSHITAVSGANLALLVTVLASISGFIGGRRWIGWDIALAGVIVSYAALTGFGAPIVRAAIVALFALFATRMGRKPDLATLLIITAAIMLAVDPNFQTSLSFRLSFISALALILTAQQTRPTRAADWVGVGLLATAAAQLATMPLLAPSSASPVAGIPANLLVELIVEFVYPLAWVIALVGLISTTAAAVVAIPADILCRLAFGVVDELAPLGLATSMDLGTSLFTKLLAGMGAGGLALFGADGKRIWHRLMTMPRRQFSALIAASLVTVFFFAASLVLFAFLDSA